MLKSHRPLVGSGIAACALVALVASSIACSEDAESNFEDVDASPPTFSSPDARFGGENGDAPVSTMRIAHLAPSLGPIDFCYQGARVGSFEGPVVRGPLIPSLDASDDASALADSGRAHDAESIEAEAPPPPLGYGSVSKYLTLEGTGTVTIAIVEAGTMSCASPIATGDVTLDPGKLSTLVVLEGKSADGGSAAPLSLIAFTDDRTTIDDKARVRVVHTAIRAGVPVVPAFTVRAVAGQTTMLAERVEPRAASSPSQLVPVDALGYATVGPVPAPAVLAIGMATTADASGGFPTWVSEPLDLELHPGSLHTAFVAPRDDTDVTDFEVIWCADRTTTGDRTTCTLVR